ncbi:endothelin-1 [Danio aesculapii]|uniref:endothelin-1 n=1 Tax=Danio aesculapii TaxID=1142201 RepID=UPI0024C09AE5|nr:endothelin-1 [Danio aesculapii]
MDFSFLFLISALVFILEQVSGSHTNRSPSASAAPQIHRRERRCSCENLKDKECVYFCHIGIVWVDTPSQVIPYGMGSRLRRDVERCHCINRKDSKCLRFCSYLSLQKKDEISTFRRYQPRNYKERYKFSFLQMLRRRNSTQTT